MIMDILYKPLGIFMSFNKIVLNLSLIRELQMKQIATGNRDGKVTSTTEKVLELPPPMNIQAMTKTPNSPHLVFFNIDSLIGTF